MFKSIVQYFFVFLITLPLAFAVSAGLGFYLLNDITLSVLIGLITQILFLRYYGKTLLLSSWHKCLIFVTFSIIFICRLYNPELGPLVSFGCADAANHLNYLSQLKQGDFRIYQGFSALYYNWVVFEWLFNLDSHQALALTLSLVPVVLAYFLALFAPTSAVLHTIIYFLLGCFLAELSILPALHYHQADGYLAHLYSLPLVLLLVFHGISINWPGLVLLIVALRFTYGLQLAELSLAAGAAILIQNRPGFRGNINSPTLIAKYYWIPAVLLLFIGFLTFIKLLNVFSASGSIVSQDLLAAFAAQVVGLLILSIKINDLNKNNRLYLFLFLIFSSIIQILWLSVTNESEYYFSKLFLYSSIVLSLLIANELPNLLKNYKSFTAPLLIVLLFLVVRTQSPYMPTYNETSLGSGGGYTLVAPLLDQKVKEAIDEIAILEGKPLFFFFTSRWAQHSYLNSLYKTDFSYDKFLNPPVELPSSSCLVWTANSNDLPRLAKHQAPTAMAWLNNLNSRSDIKEIKYKTIWAGRQTIKYLCSLDRPISLM